MAPTKERKKPRWSAADPRNRRQVGRLTGVDRLTDVLEKVSLSDSGTPVMAKSSNITPPGSMITPPKSLINSAKAESAMSEPTTTNEIKKTQPRNAKVSKVKKAPVVPPRYVPDSQKRLSVGRMKQTLPSHEFEWAVVPETCKHGVPVLRHVMTKIDASSIVSSMERAFRDKEEDARDDVTTGLMGLSFNDIPSTSSSSSPPGINGTHQPQNPRRWMDYEDGQIEMAALFRAAATLMDAVHEGHPDFTKAGNPILFWEHLKNHPISDGEWFASKCISRPDMDMEYWEQITCDINAQKLYALAVLTVDARRQSILSQKKRFDTNSMTLRDERSEPPTPAAYAVDQFIAIINEKCAKYPGCIMFTPYTQPLEGTRHMTLDEWFAENPPVPESELEAHSYFPRRARRGCPSYDLKAAREVKRRVALGLRLAEWNENKTVGVLNRMTPDGIGEPGEDVDMQEDEGSGSAGAEVKHDGMDMEIDEVVKKEYISMGWGEMFENVDEEMRVHR